MKSPRLRYRPVEGADLDALLELATDGHVKRYLFDGETVTRQWCVDAIATSRRSFAASGMGLWLVYVANGDAPIGFCGYWVFEELGPEMQLLYAFTEAHTGRGYATETAAALVETARAAGMTEIVSAVDEPNAASMVVLERVGFRRTGSVPGAFGKIVTFVIEL